MHDGSKTTTVEEEKEKEPDGVYPAVAFAPFFAGVRMTGGLLEERGWGNGMATTVAEPERVVGVKEEW